jgi:WD40 repeat protein
MRLMNDKSGFGTVYEAFERNVPKLLKILKPEYSQNAKAVDLFRQEAIVLSQLSHPGIPAVESDGYFQYLPHHSQEPLHCLVMEKIDGVNLREWMRQQGKHPISEKLALTWLKQLADVLHLVHQKNYFHRDIKPENIMLRSTGKLVLVDFGAAKEMTLSYMEQVGKTGGVTRISSAGYTPPEQEKGQAVPQSDFYALGCTFIYLLTGNQPTDVGMYDYFNNEFTWREHAPDISPGFADFIDRLVANRVSDRPRDTQEILDTIPKLLLGETETPVPITAINAKGEATLNQSQQAAKQTKKWIWSGAIALLLLTAGGYGLHHSYSVQVIDSTTQPIQVSQELTGHKSFINSLVITPDGSTLMSGSADTTIKLWNLATGKNIQTLEGHTSYVNTLAIAPDGKTLVSGSADSTMKLWDLTTGKAIRTLQGHQGYVNALDINPDGTLLASVSTDKTIRLWNLKTGITIRTLKGHDNYINSLIFSPDGKMLFSTSADTTIKQWDVETGQELRTLTGHTGYVNQIAISADGKTLYSASADKTIRIWDLTSTAAPRILTDSASFVNAIAISADGQTLISGGGDQQLKIWDLPTGTVRQTLTGYGKDINYFVVSPEWDAIATGSGGKVIKIWQLQK